MKDGKIFGKDSNGPLQLLPHVNPWAYEMFVKAQANNWVPTEISMAKDIEHWQGKHLSEDERLLVRRCLGFFAGSESLVANNLLLSIFKVVSDAECRQYILRQAYEESLHSQTIVYISDSLNLDVSEIYEAYIGIPSIKAKDDFLMEITSDMARSSFDMKYDSHKLEALRNIISYYIICEGIFFYSGFAMLLNFGRQNKLPGVSEQISYSLRDESLHLQFGTQLINTIAQQHPELWTPDFQRETLEHVKKAVELEVAYAYDVLPRGILGLSAPMFVDYVQYIANRRLEGIGLPKAYDSPRNPFPWMTEAIDITKQKNFFETRVIDYQVGGLATDEEW